MSSEECWPRLRQARFVQVATTTPEGDPVLRTLNSVVVGTLIVFHGAIAGEKARCLGRTAVVAVSEEIVDVPSTFFGAENACPATAFYESVEARGPLVSIDDDETKARALQAFMEHLQPEGGYAPIRADSPLYAKELRGVRVFGVSVEMVSGKRNLGQDKPPEVVRAIVERLWERGGDRDVAAIERILAHSPEARPDFLRAACEWTISFAVRNGDEPVLGELLLGEYWRSDESLERLVRSHLESPVWIGARDASGRLVGVARGISDGTWRAVLMDVVVRPDLRDRGIGRVLVRTFLAHPRVRAVRHLELGTRDKQSFYERFGFRVAAPAFLRMVREGEATERESPGSRRPRPHVS